MSETKIGTVIWFSSKKGIGFIAREGEADLFVHYSNIIAEGYKTLREGQKVSYELGENHKGPQGVNVRVVEEAPEETEK